MAVAVLMGVVTRSREANEINETAGDLKGSPRLFDAGLGVRRFIVAEGKLPNMQLRVWEPRGYVGDPVEGTFPGKTAVEGAVDR